MNTVQRIAKNTVFLVVGELATVAAGFFFVMYVARYLGAEGFGILSFAFAFAAIFGVFADIGLSTLTTREVARDKTLAAKYLGNIAVVKLVLGAIVFGAIVLTINLLGYPQQTISVVYFISLSVIVNAFTLMFQSVFMAYERMEFVAIGRILEVIVRLGAALLVIRLGLGVVDFASIFLAAGLLSLVYSAVIAIRKFAPPKIEIDWLFWKKTMVQAWPFALTVAFSTVYHWTDSVMLSLMKGNEAVGLYGAASRLVMALVFIPVTYFGSVFPVMSRAFTVAPESLKFISEKSLKYMLIMAVAMGIGTVILAEKIILQIFGSGFSSSILVLQILIWSASFIFIGGGFARLLISLDRQAIVAKVTGVSVFINVLLNLVLIPRLSYIGASVATVITELGALVLVAILIGKIGYGATVAKLLSITGKVLLAGGAMGLFVFLLRDILALWWLIPLAALFYFSVLYIIRGIDKEDILLLRQAARRRQTVDIPEKASRL